MFKTLDAIVSRWAISVYAWLFFIYDFFSLLNVDGPFQHKLPNILMLLGPNSHAKTININHRNFSNQCQKWTNSKENETNGTGRRIWLSQDTNET